VKVYCVGDIHGMSGLLRQALAFIAVDAKDQPAHVIFLGNCVDRGPDSKGVLDLLMAGPTNPRHVWTALTGNHDQLMADALAGDETAQINWLHNGGLTTLGSFGLSLYDWNRIPEPYRAFLADRPLWAEDEQRIYVHTGLRPGVPLERQGPEDLLWIREPFLGADHDFGRLVVHGHTPCGAHRLPAALPAEHRHRRRFLRWQAHGRGLGPRHHGAPLLADARCPVANGSGH